MKKFVLLLLFMANYATAQTPYQKDFEEFWDDIAQNYAYLDQQNIDWQKAKSVYASKVAGINDRDSFIRLLENMINEFHNGHISLNVNLNSSNRIVPSGADIWVEKTGDDFVIKDLRKDSGAEKCGLNIGMHIVKFNGKEIAVQLEQFYPKSTDSRNPEICQYAISMLFAGTHENPRKISVIENGIETSFFPDKFASEQLENLMEAKLLKPDVGYIKINNSLGNNGLIAEFDQAVDQLSGTKSLIIDLTDTPGGGNTTVARAMMGRFTSQKVPYQQHEFDEKEFDTKRFWVEYVIPRKTIYRGKIYVLVGHWTGSMGEGLAIGFDNMENATVIGTEMAGLIGAVSSFELSQTKIRFQIPTERLYHINGTPREDFQPGILTQNGNDSWKKISSIIHLR